ncbi:unnamed protein product [Cuscuta epithymum]|uniref:Gamma-glutamylcyclotransferase n=1 Tax=Cuscuta epithymum TaxID=186058 RepID=A0AAV0F0E2_9ASTE|nr:unnamed protein product [Cuscuta epithymum]CAH9128813.1 unnamed protein product [Cuscuta epithymum]
MGFWIFGYGSLVWNPGFEYDEKKIGYIRDYRRVFDLACIDHRGTPQNPARTCTLEKSEGAICWGAAYCVRGGAEKEQKAMEYLERRECEYDHKSSMDFFTEQDPVYPAVTGVLVQIATAFGPCGNNREYIFKMEKALHDIGHEDKYIVELANEVRKALGMVGVSGLLKEKKMLSIGSGSNIHPSLQLNKSLHLSPLQICPLPEAVVPSAVAIATDT